MKESSAKVIPDRLGAAADSAVPAGAFDQGVDNFGPQSRTGRIAMSVTGGIAKDRVAKLRLVAPHFGNTVPAFDQNVVNVGEGGCEQVKIGEFLRHQSGIEDALRVEHLLLSVRGSGRRLPYGYDGRPCAWPDFRGR